MANQDTSAALLGSGLVSATTGVDVYSSVSLLGSGLASATEISQKTYSVAFSGTGDMSASVNAFVDMSPINFDGSLNGAVQSGNYINTYVTLYGFLSSQANTAIGCADVFFDMEPPRVEVLQCSNEGELVDLQVFKGNTYPVTARLSIKGDYDITGHTIRLSTQIDGDTLYTVTGTITNALAGEVSFALDPLSVDTPGVGKYDIEGNDAIYTFTYGTGEFTVLDNLTV